MCVRAGSGGWSTTIAGSSGLIAIRNSQGFGGVELAGYCESMCMEKSLRGGDKFCAPGAFLDDGVCTACPRNSYRDLSMQDGRQCTLCLNGFVTSAVATGAASALACKNWCTAARKETGLVTVDTFPRVAVGDAGGGAGTLVKV